MNKIIYLDQAPLNIDQVIALYKRTSLAERRPVDRPDIFAKMLANSNLTISAWDGDRLVGMARSLSDFAFVTYVADLLVDADYQRQGIGKRLLEETEARQESGCKIVLLAAPNANDYYPQIGFENNPRAWIRTTN